MSDSPPVIGDAAPGLVWRRRKNEWAAVWLCRTDIFEKGFSPRTVPLWSGNELTDDDRRYIVQECARLQDQMLAFGRQGYVKADQYDGTITGLCEAYQTDKDSNFPKLRYATRKFYTNLLQRLIKDHGEDDLASIRAREVLSWHKAWHDQSGVAMAHAMVGMMRTLCTFGATYLECEECERLSGVMHRMKFKQAAARTEILSAEQATAIRNLARASALPSIALAQAFQFDCTFRQKDVIGEWVPLTEPGMSDVIWSGQKWLRGLRWEEIDQNLVLRHVTSKREKEIVIDLRLAPMVMEELNLAYGLNLDDGLTRAKLPARGPVILYEVTPGRPWVAQSFRTQWRQFANQLGIPKTVKNMDSRAGAISEATDAGAALEDVRHAATHSDIAMTQRYSRGSTDKVANVMRLRWDYRNKE